MTPASVTGSSQPELVRFIGSGSTHYVGYIDVWTPFNSSGPTVTDLEWDSHISGGQIWHGTFLTTGTFANTDLTVSNENGTLASSDVFVQSAQFANNSGGFQIILMDFKQFLWISNNSYEFQTILMNFK